MDAIPTVAAFSYLGFGTLFLAMMIAWRFLPGSGDRDATRMYLVSASLLAAGAVVDVLRYVATPALAVAVSFVLTALSQLTALVAARRLLHRGSTPYVFTLVTVVGSVITVWYTLVEPDYRWRIGAVLVTGAILTGAIAWEFLRFSEPGLTGIFRIIGSIYGAFAILSLVRVTRLPGMDPTSGADQAPTTVLLNQVSALPMLLLIAVMLIMVTVRRAHGVVAEDRDIAVETSVQLLADSWADPLTGLASRARIRDIIKASIAIQPNAGHRVVLVAALDGSPAEVHGHQVADEALICMADRARSLFGIHPQDWDTAGRWGESSIIVIVPATTELSPWGRALELRDEMKSMTTPNGYTCSASVAAVQISPGTSMACLEAEIREATARALDAGPAGLAAPVRE